MNNNIPKTVYDLFKNRYIPRESKILHVGGGKQGYNYKPVLDNKDVYETLSKNSGSTYVRKDDKWYDWRLPSDHFDVVLCDCLNADPLFWRTLHQLVDVCKQDGYIILILNDDLQLATSCLFRPGIVTDWGRYMSCHVEEFQFTNEHGFSYIVFKK